METELKFWKQYLECEKQIAQDIECLVFVEKEINFLDERSKKRSTSDGKKSKKDLLNAGLVALSIPVLGSFASVFASPSTIEEFLKATLVSTGCITFGLACIETKDFLKRRTLGDEVEDADKEDYVLLLDSRKALIIEIDSLHKTSQQLFNASNNGDDDKVKEKVKSIKRRS